MPVKLTDSQFNVACRTKNETNENKLLQTNIKNRLSSLSTNLWLQCRGKKAGREGFVEQVGFKLGVTLWGNSGLWGWWNDRKTEKVSLKWQGDYDSEVKRLGWSDRNDVDSWFETPHQLRCHLCKPGVAKSSHLLNLSLFTDSCRH